MNIAGDKLTDMANIAGKMATPTAGNLPMAKKKDKAIGSKARNHNVTSTLEPTKMTRNTVMENSLGALEADTKVNMSKISKKAMVKCTGLTVKSTEDSGMTVFKQVLDL